MWFDGLSGAFGGELAGGDEATWAVLGPTLWYGAVLGPTLWYGAVLGPMLWYGAVLGPTLWYGAVLVETKKRVMVWSCVEVVWAVLVETEKKECWLKQRNSA